MNGRRARVSPGRTVLTLGALALAAASLSSESITLTTAYPSPAGIYRTVTTTSDTVLARNDGNVLLVPTGARTVAVGTLTPNAALRLDVRGRAGFQGGDVSVDNGNLVVQGGVVRARGGLQIECRAPGSPAPLEKGRIWLEATGC